MLRTFLTGTLTTALLLVFLFGAFASFSAAAACATAAGALAAFCAGIALTGGVCAMLFRIIRGL